MPRWSWCNYIDTFTIFHWHLDLQLHLWNVLHYQLSINVNQYQNGRAHFSPIVAQWQFSSLVQTLWLLCVLTLPIFITLDKCLLLWRKYPSGPVFEQGSGRVTKDSKTTTHQLRQPRISLDSIAGRPKKASAQRRIWVHTTGRIL